MDVDVVKKQIAIHLDGGKAFMPIQNLITEIPFGKIGIRPHNLPYSIYELFYHIVFAQKDILDYSNSKDYSAANWPKDYWPDNQKPHNEKEWEDLKAQFFQDRESLNMFITTIAQTLGPEALMRYLNPEEAIKRLAAAQGIDVLNLIKTQEQMAEEKEEQMSNQQNQTLLEQAGQFANSKMADSQNLQGMQGEQPPTEPPPTE